MNKTKKQPPRSMKSREQQIISEIGDIARDWVYIGDDLAPGLGRVYRLGLLTIERITKDALNPKAPSGRRKV
jgi:hypothetical protein